MTRHPTQSTLFPYTTLFRSQSVGAVNKAMNDRNRANTPPNLGGELSSHTATVGQQAQVRRGIRSIPVGSLSEPDRKSTRLNSSHLGISYAVFCLKKKKN